MNQQKKLLRRGHAVHFTDPEWQDAKDCATARGISTRSGYIRQLIHEDRLKITKTKRGGQ